MAPIALWSRLPAATIIDLVAPRDPEEDLQPQQQQSPRSPVAAMAGRFHPAYMAPRRPSRTLKTEALDAPSRVLVHARQDATSTIPGAYPGLNAGPDPGTVVGITLGSVGGFLLLLWLVYTCLSMGGRQDTVSSYGTASVVTRKSRRRHSRTHSHRPESRRETVEVRSSRVSHPVVVDPPPPPQQERVVMEETIRRASSQAPPPRPMAPPPPRMVVPDDDDDDEVVVIEEHSPPPPPRRHKSKKSHRRRSSSGASARRESGYREVDPDRFAGGDGSFRDVRRSSRHGR